MNGPYSYTVRLGETIGTGANTVKRLAIRECRRRTKAWGRLMKDDLHAKGDVRDADNQLVRQVEAYRTPSGTVKVRDVEI